MVGSSSSSSSAAAAAADHRVVVALRAGAPSVTITAHHTRKQRDNDDRDDDAGRCHFLDREFIARSENDASAIRGTWSTSDVDKRRDRDTSRRTVVVPRACGRARTIDSIGPDRPSDRRGLGNTRDRNVRSRCRCSMCPAIHINSRSWLRSSSTHEPSDPPLRVILPVVASLALG